MAEIERPVRKKPGRKTKYTEKLADDICERLSCGESLRAICRDTTMPDHTTVIRWLAKNDDFATKYARAREIQAHVWVDEMFEKASSLPQLNPTTGALDSASVAHIRNQVATMQWLAQKLNPKKYGDKITHAGDEENPIAIAEITRKVVKPD